MAHRGGQPRGTRSHPHGRHRPQPGGWSPSPQRCQHPGGGVRAAPAPHIRVGGRGSRTRPRRAARQPGGRRGQDKHGAVRNSPLPRLKTQRAGSEPGAGGSAPPAPASGGSGCRSRFPRCLRASPAGQGPGTHGAPTARSDPRCGAGPPCARSPPGVGQPGRRQGSAPRWGHKREGLDPSGPAPAPEPPGGGGGQGSVGARALPEPVPVRGPPAAPGHGRHLMAGPGTAGGGHGPQTPSGPPDPHQSSRTLRGRGARSAPKCPRGGSEPLGMHWGAGAPRLLGTRVPELAAVCTAGHVCTLTLAVPVHCWQLPAHLRAHSHPRALTASHPGSEQRGGRSPDPPLRP